jgi:hypothetical protein
VVILVPLGAELGGELAEVLSDEYLHRGLGRPPGRRPAEVAFPQLPPGELAAYVSEGERRRCARAAGHVELDPADSTRAITSVASLTSATGRQGQGRVLAPLTIANAASRCGFLAVVWLAAPTWSLLAPAIAR